MDPRLFGEFMGTLVLILLGNGVVANVVLKKTIGNNSGWIVICTGWALAVMAGVFTAIACGSSDAHINPAVTLAFAVSTGDYSKLFPYTVAQMLGAIVGAALVWIHYLPHWAATPEPDLKFAAFSPSPAIRNTAANMISEVIGTFMLVLIIAAIVSKQTGGIAPGLAPFLIGGVVWAIGLSLGGATGFPINPARFLGPRIAHAILPIAGKGGSDWAYAPVPLIGEVIGAALAGIFVKIVHL
jgi:glycerol uptake facilitator